jgi:hypothetical protein
MLIFKKTISFIFDSSLNVVMSSMICAAVFYKLPLGIGVINIDTVSLLGICTWAIYILDRLADNVKFEMPNTRRHSFHFENQYILQALLIGLIVVGVTLLFFQTAAIIKYGLVLLAMTFVYFWLIHKTSSGKYFKEFFMPVIYTAAVCGISIVEKSSTNISTWLLVAMFWGICLQNLLLFSYFEYENQTSTDNVCKKMAPKSVLNIVKYIGAAQIFLFIFFFSGNFEFSSQIAFVIMLVSTFFSFAPVLKSRLMAQEKYRWVLDSLFFLFAFLV